MSFKKAIIVIVVIILSAAAAFTAYFYKMITTPVSVCPDYRIYIRPDDNQESILALITQSDSVARTKGLTYFLNRRNYDSNIHTDRKSVV